MRFTITSSARRDIGQLPAPVRSRLERKLRYWQDSNRPLEFATPLVRPHVGTHRFRVGPYRVIVKKTGVRELRILRVRHRKEVYR